MKTVRIADLKDHLSAHLRAVEAGAEIVVTDRNRPIVRIVPVASPTPAVTLIPPPRDIAEVRDLVRTPVTWSVASTELLLEERAER
jgi:prevent-host-death family protein